MLSGVLALKGALITIFIRTAVTLNISRILWNGGSECDDKFDHKKTENVDLSYMFTESDLVVLVKGNDSQQFVPGLEALLRPFISLEVDRELKSYKINNSSLKIYKLESHSKNTHFRALFGSLRMRQIYQTDFKIVADPNVRMSGSFVVAGIELGFLEYNTTVPNGNYIGYNLVIHTDLEIIYMVSIELTGTTVRATLYLEISGVGPIVFSDNTNCEVVEKRPHLNRGRTCGPQILDEVTKWKGVSKSVVSFVRPAVFQAIWCSFRKVIPNAVEMIAAYAVMLTK